MIIRIGDIAGNGERIPARSIALPFLRRPVQLGDAIHRATAAAGIPHCGGCEKRQHALNGLVRFVPRGTR